MPDVADEFDWLYDEAERRQIEGQQVLAERPQAPDEPGGDSADRATVAPGLTTGGMIKRYGMLGAFGARSMLGLADAIETEKSKPTIIEFAPDRLAEDEQLVTFVFVAGDPKASRLIIRPWLRRWSA
jgi:hypothetical protein